MTAQPPLRFAVVGMGHISQVAVLPAFEHTEGLELTAIFSSTASKLAALGDRYAVPHCLSYADYDDFLRSGAVDAVYIALPNHLHCEYTERAARAGVHVLCEKPMARTEEQCVRMIRACEAAGVQLMTAYRLHFEETNLRVVEAVQSGRIGDPRMFNAVFTMEIKDDDVRLGAVEGGGPVFDIGIYCINAARYVFRDEPVRVSAFAAAGGGDPRFREVEEGAVILLEFPRGRLATIATSFGATSADEYRVLGTAGDIRVEPAFGYAGELAFEISVGDDVERRRFPRRDQFAPVLMRFAECVRNDQRPEPDGYEGLADVRIIEAARTSAREGRLVSLEPIHRDSRPSMEQEMRRPPVESKPAEVDETGPRAG